MRRNKTFFAETCLYEAVGSLPVMPSLLPHVLWGRSQVSLFFASVGSPVLVDVNLSNYQTIGAVVVVIVW